MEEIEAEKIFKEWKEFVEIDDKLGCIFSILPESFLPYPPKKIEEALNIIAKKYWDTGNKEYSKTIQDTIGFLVIYKDDETAILSMLHVLENMQKHKELKQISLKNLKEASKSWLSKK